MEGGSTCPWTCRPPESATASSTAGPIPTAVCRQGRVTEFIRENIICAVSRLIDRGLIRPHYIAMQALPRGRGELLKEGHKRPCSEVGFLEIVDRRLLRGCEWRDILG